MSQDMSHTRSELERAKSVFEAEQEIINSKSAILTRLISSLNARKQGVKKESPGMVDGLIDNGGVIPDEVESEMFERFMTQRKIELEQQAIEKLQLDILERKIVIADSANAYSNAYSRCVMPMVEREVELLLNEIDEVFAERIGRVVGLIQAVRDPMGGNAAFRKLVRQENDPITKIMDKLSHIVNKIDWVEHALKWAPEEFPGQYPRSVINALETGVTPAQAKRMEHDVEYKRAIASGMVDALSPKVLYQTGEACEAHRVISTIIGRAGN